MNKNRYKELIGESVAEGKNKLLSSQNVTDSKLAEKLKESESKLVDSKKGVISENKKLTDKEIKQIVAEKFNKKKSKPVLSEGIQMGLEDTISIDMGSDCDCGGEGCEKCSDDEMINENTIYNLTFLNEEK